MKRKIFLICVLLILLVIYFSSPKEKITNKDYKLKNDNAMAVMVYDEEQDSYIKKSSIPVGKYVLNEEKSYCTYGGEITHYNRTTGTIKYKLNIGEKCYLYFDTDLTPAYAVYSETDNSLIFYKNNDSVTEGSEYNGRVVTAKYDDIEDSVYTYDSNTATPSTPWYEYASAIKTVSVANEIMPISTAMWFRKVQNVESIDLTNLDTSKVITMERMFDNAGELSTNFSLNLGDNFDTSNVTTMYCAFQKTGYTAADFTLDLGDKFDTRNVTTMQAMFNKIGNSSQVFTLDLGDKFDTSKATNMVAMFGMCGYNSPNFKLELGNKFNTSSVTNMRQMFKSVGHINTSFVLDLGDKFDTSNVTVMEEMFATCGHSNPNFKLELSGFIIHPSCNLIDFGRDSASKIFFGEGWSNATLIAGMFKCDSQTPIEIVNAPANIQSYDFAADNRVPTFTTI